MSRPRTVLVLGGARGESTYAVARARAIAGDEGGVASIATAEPLDAEMAARIARKDAGVSERLS